MKNKFAAVALTALLALGAVACGGGGGEDETEPATTGTEATS